MKSSPVVICDEVPTKASVLGAQVVVALTVTAVIMTIGTMIWDRFFQLHHRSCRKKKKKNDQLRSLNSQLNSWSENCRASLIAIKESHFQYHQTDLLQIKHENCACCRIPSAEFSLTKSFLWFRRSRTLKLGMRTSDLTQTNVKILDLSFSRSFSC